MLIFIHAKLKFHPKSKRMRISCDAFYAIFLCKFSYRKNAKNIRLSKIGKTQREKLRKLMQDKHYSSH